MATKPQQNVTTLSLKQIGTQVRRHIEKSKDATLFKGVRTRDIPRDELVILCTYLTKGLIVEIFGGTTQSMASIVNRRIKEQREESLEQTAEEAKLLDSESGEGPDEDMLDSEPTPIEPMGIGGYRFGNRLSSKVIRNLEKMIDSGVVGAGNQAVQASRELLKYADNIKKEALDVMQAYEQQLLLLAEHLVEKFLPMIGEKLKADAMEWKVGVLGDVKDSLGTDVGDKGTNAYDIWEQKIERFSRQFDRKKFEILLAESLLENPKTSDAFDMTVDMIKNYGAGDDVHRMIEDEATNTIKEAEIQREQLLGDMDYEDI